MATSAKQPEERVQVESGAQPMGLGWTAKLEPSARGAMVRLVHPEAAPVEVEITITARGPVIRASAAALEIDAGGVVDLHCEKFQVDARQGITLTAGEIVQQATGTIRAEGSVVEVNARSGDVHVHANDDVKLAGEQILLNCDRDERLPSWLPRPPAVEVTVPRESVAGDPALLEDLARH